ncbi:hypothetical protein Bca4012_058497 [Brassica carinata]
MVSPKYLTILRNFYQVSSGVTFRIPTAGESARNPPQGFFTCYEAFLAYCRMWFPIPGVIVRALHSFGLSISQLTVPSLESWLGVLVSIYELGMDLSPSDFEGLWYTKPTSIEGSYSVIPRKNMAIIQGTTSNPKLWFDRFFFVRIDGESVEESCLHLIPQEWSFDRVNKTVAHTHADLFVKRDLLRERPFFWSTFSVERIRSAVELHRSRVTLQPSNVQCDVEPIAVLPVRRRRHRSRKGKEVQCETISGDPSPLGEDPSFVPGEGDGTSEFPLPSNFFDGLPPAFTTDESLEDDAKKKVFAEGSRLINEGMRVFGAALDGSFRGSRISRFKAEEAERELFRFRKEVEERSRKQAELHSRALVRVERRGRRAIAAEMARRAESFATEFESLKEAQEFVGDFRECRGSVSNLHKSQNPGFSFSSEIAEMEGFMSECAHAESLVPPIQGRVRKLCDPIEVSEDTVETGAGGNAEGVDEEVDQPVASFGISMSGFLDVDY